jgi:hypothetical protein
MELDPSGMPRLSGKLWYGPPRIWRVENLGDRIQLVPVATLRGLARYFYGLGALFVMSAMLIYAASPPFDDKGALCVGMACASVLLALAGVFIQRSLRKEQSRGSILVVVASEERIYLPREGKQWPFACVEGWDIVSGVWTRGSDRHPMLFNMDICELQVVVVNPDGSRSAWPLVGASGTHNRELESAAEIMATATNLPLRVVKTPGFAWPWSKPSIA